LDLCISRWISASLFLATPRIYSSFTSEKQQQHISYYYV